MSRHEISAGRHALADNAPYYKMLIELASDAIFLTDIDGHYVDVNVAACTLLGYTREELLQLTIPEVIPPAVNPGQPMRLQLMREGQTVLSERIARRKDGVLLPVELSARRLPDGQMHAIVRDVSARKTTEAERDRLAAVVEQTGDFVIMADVNGMTTYVNHSFSRISGFDAGQVIGRPLVETLKTQPNDMTGAEIGAALASGRTWSGSFFAVRADGQPVDLEEVVSPLRDASGGIVGWVAVGRDVSHERALEAQLRHAQKMEAIGRLAGGIAHDFNNLLAAIRGYAELTHLATEPDDEIHEYTAEILKAADRAKLLTQRLLTFARQQPTSPDIVDINSVIDGLTPMLHQIVDERTLLVVELAPEPVVVTIDVAMLEQAILNLVINAHDAIPDQGVIRLTTRVEATRPDRHVPGDSLLAGSHAVVSVTDTGSGILPEDLPHLFDPFFTTKPVNKGTGLGLSIVYAVVTAAGGSVSVNSKPGAGASFELLLPTSERPHVAAAAPAPPVESGASGAEEVLLVEDDETVRSFVARVLSRGGYRVAEAVSAEQALALIGEGAQPALLVTDILLPKASGHELADLLRSRLPGIGVIYISGYDADRLAFDGAVPAGTAFLSKPFASDDLLRAVRRILDAAIPAGD
jgi:PAS domain S-box-containing protein